MSSPEDLTFKSLVRSWSRPYWYFYVYVTLLAVLESAVLLAFPLPLKVMVDYVLGGQPVPASLAHLPQTRLLATTAISAGALLLLAGLVRLLSTAMLHKLQHVIDKKFMLRSFAAITAVPYNSPKRLSLDDELHVLNDQVPKMSRFLIGNLAIFIRWLIVFATVITIVVMFDVKLAVFGAIAAVGMLLIALFATRRSTRQPASPVASEQRATGLIEDSLRKLRLVQEYAKEKLQVSKLQTALDDQFRTERRMATVGRAYGVLNLLIISLAVAFTFAIGGNLVASGRLVTGDILMLTAYLVILLAQFLPATAVLKTRQEQLTELHSLAETLRQVSSLPPVGGTLTLPEITGKMELNKVRLQGTYKLIFTELNLVLEPRTITAVIGGSGSGKSSLLSLFNGFMSPTEGRVLLDGVSLSELDPDFLRRNVAFVDQESLMMKDTIANNIAFGDPDRPNNLPDVMAAAVVSNASEFVDTLKGNYQTEVVNDLLSGGQKQRLAIARAYYAKTPIIIMDEPTAALDRRSAEIFAENLFKYFINRTVLIATHDLALLRQIKNVYMLQDQTLVPVPDVSKLDFEKYRLVG